MTSRPHQVWPAQAKSADDSAAGTPAVSAPVAPPPILTKEAKPRSLIVMRRFANGLLVAMTILFVFSHLWRPDPGVWRQVWGYVRAFAEAAMVGGLADWFAVTAIFRRPLGLPIPHTAVIPRNQKRIADAVGRFIADNFLEPGLVAERVKSQDLSDALGKWLADPAQSGALSSELVSAVPALLDALDDETVSSFLRKQAADAASGASIAPAFGSVLEALAEQGRHQAILDALLKQGWKLLRENEYMIRERVRGRSGWLMRFVSADQKVADSLIDAIADLLHDVSVDMHHPLRMQLNDMVTKFADDLRRDPLLQKRIGQWIREAAFHPTVAGAVEAGWDEFKQSLRRDCANPEGSLRKWLQEALVNLGRGLIREPAVREALNVRIRSLLVELADRHGEDVARLVSDTIRSWDADTIVEKLETNVGRDLQFIRLNGTVIGGLVGVGLHLGAELLG
jgi:uncharacterized membrane-anchored protein YjiN (DUF445 family)